MTDRFVRVRVSQSAFDKLSGEEEALLAEKSNLDPLLQAKGLIVPGQRVRMEFVLDPDIGPDSTEIRVEVAEAVEDEEHHFYELPEQVGGFKLERF